MKNKVPIIPLMAAESGKLRGVLVSRQEAMRMCNDGWALGFLRSGEGVEIDVMGPKTRHPWYKGQI